VAQHSHVFCFYLFQTGRLTFSALWRKVLVGEPNRRDLVNIIKGCYPSLEPISTKLIGR
jgi:midasin